MADKHRDAARLQALDIGVAGDVGALHRIAERVQRLGYAAHTDAANTHEVDRTDIQRQRSHSAAAHNIAERGGAAGAMCNPSDTDVTRSASRLAASGVAAAKAHAAA